MELIIAIVIALLIVAILLGLTMSLCPSDTEIPALMQRFKDLEE